MKNIVVFFGGNSTEHDVSIITGVLTLNSLDKQKFSGIPVYISKKGNFYTGETLKNIDNYKNLNLDKLDLCTFKTGKNTLYKLKKNKLKEIADISVAINCMHGVSGEDGALSGLLSFCNIPLASPDILSSAVSLDKCITKIFPKGLKINVLPSVTVNDFLDAKKSYKLGFPLIVKPCDLGSSIGIKKVNTKEELDGAVRSAFRYSDKVLVEKCLENFREINCACYKTSKGELKVSPCEEPVGKGDILSFEDKYSCGKRNFPAEIDEQISCKIQEITKTVYKELGFDGIIRIDYLLEDNKIYLNEINSVPGSLAFYLFSDTLAGFTEILSDLIKQAEIKYAKGCCLQRTYYSSILNFNGLKGCKTIVKQ